MNQRILTSTLLLCGLLAAPWAAAQNRQSCCVGQKTNGTYHIACDQPARNGMGILQNMRASNISCTPQSYLAHAKRLCADKKAVEWTTNVLEVPTHCEDLALLKN